MTPERLRTLIAAGETLAVEFKGEEHGALPDRDLVQTVVCLANRPGDASGWLLIGVEDDGRVTGAQPRHEGGHTDPYRVQALIANRTRPALSVRVEVMGLDGRDVLVIEVPAARLPIGTTAGQYLRAAHGRITRRETAALCRITSLQARTVLNRLVRQGKHVRQGARRGVFYILASKNMD